MDSISSEKSMASMLPTWLAYKSAAVPGPQATSSRRQPGSKPRPAVSNRMPSMENSAMNSREASSYPGATAFQGPGCASGLGKEAGPVEFIVLNLPLKPAQSATFWHFKGPLFGFEVDPVRLGGPFRQAGRPTCSAPVRHGPALSG